MDTASPVTQESELATTPSTKTSSGELKLDLGCGDNKQAGFTGVDLFKTDSTDVVHDLLTFPWPFEDGSVSETHSSHFLEHVPAKLRPAFMDELYRVLKPGAKATFVVPYYKSARAIQDFTHEWPPLAEASFLYFNKEWRKNNKLEHGFYDMKCDFDFTYGYSLDPLWAGRQDDARAFAFKHYWEAISDMVVTMIKRG